MRRASARRLLLGAVCFACLTMVLLSAGGLQRSQGDVRRVVQELTPQNTAAAQPKPLAVHAHAQPGASPQHDVQPAAREPDAAAHAPDAATREPDAAERNALPARKPDAAAHSALPAREPEPASFTDAASLRRIAAWYMTVSQRPNTFNVSAGGAPPHDAFLPGYRNPCWVAPNPAADALAAAPAAGRMLRCMPSFFLLGAFQSGVHDLWQRYSLHPGVARPNGAIEHFIIEQQPWERFIAGYDRAAAAAPDAVRTQPLGDISPGAATLPWAHTCDVLHFGYVLTTRQCWAKCDKCDRSACMAQARADEAAEQKSYGVPPGLDGLLSRFQTPWLLRALVGLPRTRLAFILRNPVHRTHAAFVHYEQYAKRYGGVDGAAFQRYLDESMPVLADCLARHSRLQCAAEFESLAFHYEQLYYHADQIIKSMYGAFVTLWRDAFPDEAMLFLRFEAYIADPRPSLDRLFRHVGVASGSALGDEHWRAILSHAGHKHSPSRLAAVPMLESSRAQLQRFFAPDVAAMAAIDDDFLAWGREAA